MGLSEGRLEHAFVTHAIKTSKASYCNLMDAEHLIFSKAASTHFANSSKTSTYSSMKSTATST